MVLAVDGYREDPILVAGERLQALGAGVHTMASGRSARHDAVVLAVDGYR